MTEYWPVVVHIDGKCLWLAWYTGEPDGFLLSEDGHVVFRPLLECLRDAVNARSGRLSDDIHRVDLDRCWEQVRAGRVVAKEVNSAWNVFTDLSRSVGKNGWEPAGADRLYDKVFHACNLPAATPPGHRFRPSWTATDFDELRAVLCAGRSMTRSVLRS